MTIFRAIFCGVFCALVSAPAFAGVGSVDGRKYVDWKDYPQVVSLFITMSPSMSQGYSCTGQYIAPNLIITAAHCVKSDNGDIKAGYVTASNYKGEEFELELIKTTDWNGRSVSDIDWAVLKVKDEKYYTDKYYNMGNFDKNAKVPVYNAGFGWVRILSDAEIETLKQIYAASANPKQQDVLLSEFNAALGENNGLRDEDDRLKVDTTCTIHNTDSDCDTWGGNSGGPYVMNGNNLVAVHSANAALRYAYSFDDKYQAAEFAAVDYFRNDLEQLIRQYSPKVADPAVVVTDEPELEDCTLAELEKLNAASGEKEKGKECVATLCKDGFHFLEPDKKSCVSDNVAAGDETSDDTDDSADNSTGAAMLADINAQKKKLDDVFQNTVALGDNMTNQQFLSGIVSNVVEKDHLKQLEEAYAKAKANEKSLKNRLVSGLTMAATGIGGMQLAQGLAEQNADKKAEQDMAAYLATFQCKVGDNGGRSYSGGEMGIEVGGTNQLVNLYQQYVDLAASLKERKTALGMAPGIESQVIMDKANMGLYDATGGKGIENGTYASLYRASRGNETDANKLADQQNTSATRVKGGAIAAGVGAVGGAIGNAIINTDDDDDETVTEEDCKKVKGTYKDGKCTCPGKDKVYKKGKCVDKSDNNSGLAGLGASLGSSLGSSVNIGNVASMASGLMSGSGQ